MKDDAWQALIELLVKQQDGLALDSILNTLLSPDERETLTNRLSIFRALLGGGETQREIAARLGTSIATVTRCSNTLKHLNCAEKAVIQ